MKKHIFLILLAGLCMSCSNDGEDETPNEVSDIDLQLDGTWQLNAVNCFCFYGDDFNFGAHTVTFENADNTVVIENGSEAQFVSPAGTYAFSIQDGIITMNITEAYTYEIKENTLTLTFVDRPDVSDDEITLRYTKI